MEFNSNRKAALAVTAGLVGALTLGGAAVVVAPVAAYATGAEALAVSPLQDADLYQAKDGKGNWLEGAEKGMQLTVGQVLVPVSLTINGVPTTVVQNGDGVNGYKLEYYKLNAKGDKTGKPMTVKETQAQGVGSYVVEVSKDGAKWSAKFSVAVKSLKGAVAYEVNADDASDVSDTTFTFNGQDLSFGFALDGKALTTGEYTLDGVWKDGVKQSGLTMKDAGSYTLKLVGKGVYDKQIVNIPVTVGKLDLSSASVSVADVVKGLAAANKPVVKVNGTQVSEDSNFHLDYAGLAGSAEGANGYTGSKGQWRVTVSAAEGSKNVTGSKDATFNAVVTMNSTFSYNGTAFSTNQTIDQAKGESFDASKIKVVNNVTGKAYAASDLEVTYKDVKGNAVSDLTKPGTYTVTVRVKPDSEFQYGGSAELKVTVTNKLDGDLYVTFKRDGKIVQSVSETYDGSDILKTITVEVKDSEGNVLEQGSDYTLETKVNGTNKVVDSIVNAYSYTVSVKSDKYEISNATLPVTVAKAKITPKAKNHADYTGKAVAVPGVKYDTGKDEDGKDVYADLPADLYKVVSVKVEKGEIVSSVIKPGWYTATIQLTDAAKVNYELVKSEFDFKVIKWESFKDVAPEAWYAKAISQAKDVYVNGISGTGLFQPERHITRAEAVTVIFNMAKGVSGTGTDDFKYDGTKYDTGFSDADDSAWYSNALAWAHKTGIANGYGDGTFKPGDSITREEFAALLVNYAKALRDYERTDGSALAGMADRGSVSAWAEGAVDWAVANKVMGNGGFVAGQSEITRAEVAAMAVNYQPVVK